MHADVTAGVFDSGGVTAVARPFDARRLAPLPVWTSAGTHAGRHDTMEIPYSYIVWSFLTSTSLTSDGAVVKE